VIESQISTEVISDAHRAMIGGMVVKPQALGLSGFAAGMC
jgi:hypothetical protein